MRCRVQGLGDVGASGETVAVGVLLPSHLKEVTVVEPHSYKQGFIAAEMKQKINRCLCSTYYGGNKCTSEQNKKEISALGNLTFLCGYLGPDVVRQTGN